VRATALQRHGRRACGDHVFQSAGKQQSKTGGGRHPLSGACVAILAAQPHQNTRLAGELHRDLSSAVFQRGYAFWVKFDRNRCGTAQMIGMT